MNWFAVLFFSLSIDIEKSLAAKCAPTNTLDISWLADYYKAAARSPVFPVLEYGDKSAAQFQNMFGNSVKRYGRELMINLQNQATNVGEQLVKDIQIDVDRLEESIEWNARASNTESIDQESALKNITDHLGIFLELKPGNSEFERPELPPLPAQQIPFESRTTKLSPKEVFLNFESTINILSGHVFAYVTYLYLRGWSDVRTQYETIRLELYNGVNMHAILNREVLDAHRMAVDKIYKQCQLIERNVSPRTWKSFKDAGDRVIAISDDCNSSN